MADTAIVAAGVGVDWRLRESRRRQLAEQGGVCLAGNEICALVVV
jgi:hypothetical protein